MTDREIMRQALEALEEINKLSIGENAICLPAEIDGAMDALRERLAQPEQESVKFCTYPKCQTTAGCAGVCARQNTTPQPRQWVGLTDDEADELVARFARYELLRRVEAKLKEKNI